MGLPAFGDDDNFLLALCDAVELRDAAVRRIEYHGIQRHFRLDGVQKAETETCEQFLSRRSALELTLDNSPSNPFIIRRDFDSAAIHIRFNYANGYGILREFLRNGDYSISLQRTPERNLQATIGGPDPTRGEEKNDFGAVDRFDLRAFRPVFDREIHTVLRRAISPEPIVLSLFPNRPVKLNLIGKANTDGCRWTVVFCHVELRPRDSNTTWLMDSWHRMEFVRIASEVALTRVDSLESSDELSVPKCSVLIDAYQLVNGVQIPHRVRHFLFGKDYIQGMVSEATTVSANNDVEIPKSLDLPGDTYVQDLKTDRRYRVPVDGAKQDRKIEKTVEELQKHAGFAASSAHVWLFLVNCVALTLIGGILWYRRKKRI